MTCPISIAFDFAIWILRLGDLARLCVKENAFVVDQFVDLRRDLRRRKRRLSDDGGDGWRFRPPSQRSWRRPNLADSGLIALRTKSATLSTRVMTVAHSF